MCGPAWSRTPAVGGGAQKGVCEGWAVKGRVHVVVVVVVVHGSVLAHTDPADPALAQSTYGCDAVACAPEGRESSNAAPAACADKGPSQQVLLPSDATYAPCAVQHIV